MLDPSNRRPIDTIRLNHQQKQTLLDAIEAESGQQKSSRERRTLRVRFNPPDGYVMIALTHPTGQRVRYSVLPRNLSRKGMAFAHGQFVYPGSECDIAMQDKTGQWWQLHGKVARCRHVKGIIHEASVVFSRPAELSRFVDLTNEQRDRDAAEYRGRLHDASVGCTLLVEPATSDRKLFELWLNNLGLNTDATQTLGQSLRQANRGQYALAIVNMDLGDENGCDLLSQLRAGGFNAPIIAISSQEDQTLQAESLHAGANAFLAKPFDAHRLQQVIAQLIGVGLDAGEPLFSYYREDEQMQPLLREFADELSIKRDALRQANLQGDMTRIGKICQSLKGSGASYGFDTVSNLSQLVLESLAQGQRDVEKVHETVKELIQLLHRVHVD